MSSIVICGSSEGNISLSEKRERVLNKLVEGHKHATELKHLLQNQNQNQNQNLPPTSSSAEALLISKILRSFTETLSDLDSSSASPNLLASSLNNDNNYSSQPVVAANSYSTNNNDLKSEGSSESSKRSSSSVPKDRRGTYKRRKTEETWSNVSSNTDDDCAWRKYGQKEILNSKFPRSYYRCTRKFDQGCKATKQVQRIQDDPVLYQITYIGRHTCKESLKASQMMTTTNPLNPKDHHQTPPSANAIIKQEDTTPSDDLIVAEKLDGNLWSDLKDFEITNPPPTSADNNFWGVFFL
ncbi:WRKY Transcription Factor [Stylosanthes scabra]|uniref:WRKY Transcription Factor n=1 Tax=Stylosanthes scabra TaxID=79078 RepID=A0ABU6XC63_9FABA|nr:WRKY Transcription Factor [Stylosanthes scabra]